ncbi:MAG: YjgN family protein [Nitrospirota bacterium]
MLATFEMCQSCGRLYEHGAACDRCGSGNGQSASGHQFRMAETPPPIRAAEPSLLHAPAPSARELPNDGPTVVARPQAQAATPDSLALAFHGQGGSFFGIHIVNMLLSMVTLGVYYFWGKVKVRRYLYSQSEFHGDRFAYHGTGKELFLGFLRAAVAFGAIWVLLNFGPMLPGGLAVKIASVVLAYCALAVFVPYAIASSRRYRMSRASWRGIRFSFRGAVGDFIRLYVKGTVLSGLTFGIYYPYFVARQQKFLVSHTYFGTARFGFDGEGRELSKIYAAFVALPALAGMLFAIFIPLGAAMEGAGKIMAAAPFVLLPVIALGWFWFQANRQRYLWNHTTFGEARFRATMTGGRLCLLKLGNLFLLVLTLGLAWPWVLVRNVNFTVRHLSLEGPVDLAAIQQEAQSSTAIGEGLDTVMDLDVGFAA